MTATQENKYYLEPEIKDKLKELMKDYPDYIVLVFHKDCKIIEVINRLR